MNELKSFILLVLGSLTNLLFVTIFLDKYDVNRNFVVMMIGVVVNIIWVFIWLFKIYPMDKSGEWECQNCSCEFDTDEEGNVEIIN